MLNNLFLSVLNMSITASFVILVVLFVRLLLKKAPKIFSYILWTVVLFRLICPFSFESVIGLLPISKAPIQQDIIYNTKPQINMEFHLVDHAINPTPFVPDNTKININSLQIWAFVGSIIWAFGILAMLIYTIIQFVRLKRKLIGAAPLRDNIYLADYTNSPFVIGFIKPKIYLPSSIMEAEQEFIIIHEQCHIRRFDHIIRIFAFIALVIHWFNPFVWLAFILSGKDMEMSCDEAVMKKMDTDIRAEYSQSLLRFAAGKKSILAAPLAFGEGDTKDRIKNVMKYKKPMLWVSIVAVITVVVVVLGLISNPKSEQEQIKTENVSLKRLWENRTEYVGNNSAVGNILSELSFPSNIKYKSFELKTKKPPYEIIIYFEDINNILKTANYNNKQTETIQNVDSAQLEQNAKIMFSLIGNVEKITFCIIQKDNETLTSHYMRNKYEELFTKTASYEEFQTVLDKIFNNKENNFIADFETIKIGTPIETIHEQFGKPDGTLSGMYGDIYIVDNKRITIYYGSDKELGYPVTDIKIEDYTQKKLTYDQAVAAAVISGGNRYLEGECIGEGHIILGYNKGKNKTKIYALTMIGWYGFENNNFVKISGSGIIPVVVTLDNNNAVEIKYPLDGGYYKISIEEMFPKKYHKRILEYTDSNYNNLKQQEEQYAKDYLSKLERKAKIGETSDFKYTLLTDVGVSVEVSNKLEYFYKEHSYYPSFIGTYERLENGTRMVYEMSYHKNQDEVRFIKYNYDTKEITEQFIADAKTGDIAALSDDTSKVNKS